MPPRKERIPVVLDTNVIAGYYLTRSAASPNARVFRLWRDERRLQLVVTGGLVAEYVDVLRRLGVAEQRVQRFEDRLHRRATVTHIRLGPRYSVSRDPDDNALLAAAAAGRARFLITNDRDVLELPPEHRRRFRFAIVTPHEFLAQLND